ncbi:MAG: gamma-glutamyl-gamma-aminobutyrate hydrolase family protein [Candidatus Aminicenantes bacterium]|nr:gamma-glutamyl-gamma-aminobutyrate hydrolase family protein [Candidatus Aminicenantes bacterium]
MKIISSIITLTAIIITLFIPLQSAIDQSVVIAMTSPSVKQIKNIEILYEKDLLRIEKIKLICIYHENEKADYSPSMKYTEANHLTWVSFITINGLPPFEDIFKLNQWTPQFKRIFDQSQGVIFTGGYDIPPSIYGEENNLLSSAATPIRSRYECSFLFHLLGGRQNPDFTAWLESRKSYVVLGICLGAQSMNVATGGTLVQDIPSQIYHLNTIEQVLKLSPDKIHSSIYIKKLHPFEKDMAPAFHQIKFGNHSLWTQKMGLCKSDCPFVLSSHHQSIKNLGKDIVVTATSLDGKVIEAIAHSRYNNVLGVQFHPEYFALYQKGKHFKKKPGSSPNLNLRSFLMDHPPAMKFHIHLWKWFSEALIQCCR